VGVPDGFDYELHNRKDIERVLGDKAWAISYKDSACRCYGYMVSLKPAIPLPASREGAYPAGLGSCISNLLLLLQ